MIDRIAAAVLAAIPRLLWGFSPALMQRYARLRGDPS